MKEDVKKIKQNLMEKYGSRHEKIITQELLSAINSLKGSGKPGAENNRLSQAEIEDRVAIKIRRHEAGDTSHRANN
jgi:hypothetical protein